MDVHAPGRQPGTKRNKLASGLAPLLLAGLDLALAGLDLALAGSRIPTGSGWEAQEALSLHFSIVLGSDRENSMKMVKKVKESLKKIKKVKKVKKIKK